MTKEKTAVTLLVFFLILPAFLLPAVNASSENSWTPMKPIPTIRKALGVAVVNGKIYAIGGKNDNGYLSTNEEYDPATNTWTTKAPMPTSRSGFGIAVVNNKIYCIGGKIDFNWDTGEHILCSINQVYDPLTDTWENKTSMPTKRERTSTNVVHDKIYLIGGFKAQTSSPYKLLQSPVNEVYDPQTDTWTTKTSIPTTSYGATSATVNNKIYVIGGLHSDLNQIYDPATDTWSQGAPIPTAVALAGAGATSGEKAPELIYVIGGYPSYDEVHLNQVYDPQTDTWTIGKQMITARHSLGVAVINDTLYAVGGGSSNLNVRYYEQNERYTPIGYVTEFSSQLILVLFAVLLLVVLATVFGVVKKLKKA
ncbi:MAG: hypothetical protein CW691_00285 [Candidatus Bathyarchaeum sp.]|nr:MAG: hypothetical protein CW691_00285 [Candidatus Bathyarchaeum sp.]